FKSHLEFDAIVSAASLEILYKTSSDSTQLGKIENLSSNWNTDHLAYAYALLSKNATEKDLNFALAQISQQKFKENTNLRLIESRIDFQQFTEITPGPVVNNSNVETLPVFVYYIFGRLILFILIASCLNYMSISI